MKHDHDFFMFLYKTEFCPINWEHNTEKCVYAHDIGEYRRNVSRIPYNIKDCPSI